VNVSYIPASGTVACIFYQVLFIPLFDNTVQVSKTFDIYYLFLFICIAFGIYTVDGIGLYFKVIMWNTAILDSAIVFIVQLISVMLGRPETLQG